jgi:beta-lactamase class A
MAAVWDVQQAGPQVQLDAWKYVRAAVLVAGSGALGAGVWHLQQRQDCVDLRFVRQDYACEARSDAGVAAYASLENDVRMRVARAQAAGEVERASVHFQRLRDGEGFGINEDAVFSPASMLKLPIVIGLFLAEERSPGTLEEQLLYAPEQVRDYLVPTQIEVASPGLEHGKTYSVERLMQATITYSDNLAYYVLLAHFSAQQQHAALLPRTLRELGIQDPHDLDDESARVREYAALFRTLYNASYLDATSSEKLLSWLGASTYDKGIAAGTPRSVAIANKFGERVLSDGTTELHDCGVVYSDDDPYVLCIMTKGKNFAALQHVIVDVSSSVYESVASGAL